MRTLTTSPQRRPTRRVVPPSDSQPNTGSTYLGIREAARALNIGSWLLYGLVKKGVVPALRAGSLLRVNVAEAADALKRVQVQRVRQASRSTPSAGR